MWNDSICIGNSMICSDIFTCRYFKLSWNTTALSQSNCRNLSCSSITIVIVIATITFSVLEGKIIKSTLSTKKTTTNLSFVTWKNIMLTGIRSQSKNDNVEITEKNYVVFYFISATVPSSWPQKGNLKLSRLLTCNLQYYRWPTPKIQVSC